MFKLFKFDYSHVNVQIYGDMMVHTITTYLCMDVVSTYFFITGEK